MKEFPSQVSHNPPPLNCEKSTVVLQKKWRVWENTQIKRQNITTLNVVKREGILDIFKIKKGRRTNKGMLDFYE
jgi:hypothetical protein